MNPPVKCQAVGKVDKERAPLMFFYQNDEQV